MTLAAFTAARRALAASVIAAAVGCSPTFNWREVRSADGYVIALPARAQTVAREVKLADATVPMSMTSTGIGATLFAVGAAKLPTAAPPQQTLAAFRDALVRNINGTIIRTTPATLSVPLGDARKVLAAEAIEASGRDAQGRAVKMSARFFVVDDRLYQLVALGGEEIPPAALDSFFTSFRLI